VCDAVPIKGKTVGKRKQSAKSGLQLPPFLVIQMQHLQMPLTSAV